MTEKSPEWYALREIAIELLRKEFGSYREDGNGILFECTNEKIAKALGYDPSHISRFLQNPTIGNSSVGKKAILNIIERVNNLVVSREVNEQLNSQQHKMSKLNEKNAALRKKDEKKRLVVWALGIACFLAVAVFIRQNNQQRSLRNDLHGLENQLERKADNFLIDDTIKLGALMKWHGEHIVHRLIWEGLEINRRIKEGQIVLETRADTIREREEIQRKVANILLEGRAQLDAIGFVMPNGDRISNCMNHYINYNSKEKNVLVSPLINESIDVHIRYLFDQRIDPVRLRQAIEAKARADQQKLWKEMEACL